MKADNDPGRNLNSVVRCAKETETEQCGSEIENII